MPSAGSSVESERGFAADVVLHLVYLAGLFTFAVVLGIVTDDISTQVDKVRLHIRDSSSSSGDSQLWLQVVVVCGNSSIAPVLSLL
jgi:hypothetical protein